MRTLFLLLILSCPALAASISGFSYIHPPAVPAAATYFVEENFEQGNGVDPAWEIGSGSGTLHYGTNSPALVGTYSYYLNGAGAFLYVMTNYSAKADVWFFFKFRVLTFPNTQASIGGLVQTSGGASLLGLSCNSVGQIRVHSASDNVIILGSNISTGTDYFIWGHYVKSTSCTIWISTSEADRTALGSGYTGTAGPTGIGTADSTNFRLAAESTATPPIWVVDKLRMSTSEIGNSPP